MATSRASATTTLRIAERFAHVEPKEAKTLLWSAAYFFAVLAAYYIVRPVRDEMGVVIGKDGLERIYIVVFLVMLAAVPLFNGLVTAVGRRYVVGLIYGLFIACLVAFRILLGGTPGPVLASTFYVWGSVFNLFTISLFWTVMSEHWSAEQATRLYGFIAAGGTLGGIAGPLFAQSLVGIVGVPNLMLVSALLLGVAVVAAFMVQSAVATAPAATQAEAEAKPGLFEGALQVWRSPTLLKIALVIFLTNLVSTVFYLEQADIVGKALPDRGDRVTLFARMDLTVNLATVAVQMLAASWVLRRFGPGLAAALLPVAVLAGFVALSAKPVLWVIVAIVVAERIVTFAVSGPGLRVFYTLVAPDEKYRAQNFTDTVVYRGGDAVSGAYLGTLTRTFGFTTAGVAMISIPLVVCWLSLCLLLERDRGRRQADVL